MSRALGGKTGRAPIGWEVGLREISLTNAFFSKSYAAGVPPKLQVSEVHRDQVLARLSLFPEGSVGSIGVYVEAFVGGLEATHQMGR